MWIWVLVIPLVVVWAGIALAACQVSSQVSRAEELDAHVDATAAELLEGIEINLLPTS
jgi:hypothetical protein